MSPNRRIKVVQNMSRDAFDVYEPVDSSDPVPFTIRGRTNNKIKGVVFSEDDEIVCGGDGYVHIFDVATQQVLEPLSHNGMLFLLGNYHLSIMQIIAP